MANNTPCSCFGKINNPPTKYICPNLKDCVVANHVLIHGEGSIGPCGETGTLDMTEYINIPEGCDTPKVFYRSHTENLENVSITSDTLTFTSKFVEGNTTTAQIVYIVSCGAKSDIGIIDIAFKNLCQDKECTDCDPCTGDCKEPSPEIQITDGSIKPEIKIL